MAASRPAAVICRRVLHRPGGRVSRSVASWAVAVGRSPGRIATALGGCKCAHSSAHCAVIAAKQPTKKLDWQQQRQVSSLDSQPTLNSMPHSASHLGQQNHMLLMQRMSFAENYGVLF